MDRPMRRSCPVTPIRTLSRDIWPPSLMRQILSHRRGTFAESLEASHRRGDVRSCESHGEPTQPRNLRAHFVVSDEDGATSYGGTEAVLLVDVHKPNVDGCGHAPPVVDHTDAVVQSEAQRSERAAPARMLTDLWIVHRHIERDDAVPGTHFVRNRQRPPYSFDRRRDLGERADAHVVRLSTVLQHDLYQLSKSTES